LDQSDQTATAGRDFVQTSGTLTFKHGETEQVITVELLDNGQDVRDETFAVQLANIAPKGAKLSKKSLKLVNIITDQETKKKQEILDQILKKIEDEEEGTWGSQFIKACMLHPAKDEEGEIQDIDPVDAFLHLVCIGWKIIFAIVPPPQYLGGWACFVMALVMIGVVTAVVGEFANLFGCVLGIEPAITAITFVALGTSLPDTFASMAAAKADAFADAAVGNVTGSNSVNVFLGLGLPWVIASHYYAAIGTPEADIFQYKSKDDPTPNFPDTRYFVFAGSLGFSVAVFCTVAITCVIFLVIRRKVVGGELGGSSVGRTGSCVFLVCLWCIYILMSILQSSDVGGLKEATKGMVGDQLAMHPLKKCNKKALLCSALTAGLWDGVGVKCD
jgi:solute carrier family 8 (sodium/calcium exchanger)